MQPEVAMARATQEALVTYSNLEKRLLKYAQTGSDLLEMANEGLIVAVRSRARLAQAVSAAQHAETHLQVVGVGDLKPRSTSPGWGDDPRVTDE